MCGIILQLWKSVSSITGMPAPTTHKKNANNQHAMSLWLEPRQACPVLHLWGLCLPLSLSLGPSIYSSLYNYYVSQLSGFSAPWPTDSFPNLQSVSYSLDQCLLGTPANWLLHLGLSISSYDLCQQQNTPEKVWFRTVKITERRVKTEHARNLLENSGWGTNHWSIECLLYLPA